MLSISRLVLAASVAVSLLLVGGTYLLLTGFGDRMLQQTTAQHLQSLGKVTFTSMYQVMNQGWKRDQVVSFADGVAKSVVGTPMQIEFHRGEVVNSQFGAVRDANSDDVIAQAMQTGRDKEISSPDGIRFLYPMKANAECLACHTSAKKGDVLGVIDIRAGYGEVMGNTRTHLMLVLLLLAPIPLVIGFVLSVMLDSRMHGFVNQLDDAIDKAQPGKAPDFNAVNVKFAEFRELLGHFKRLVKG
ncbi:MAG: hypothetical protein AB1899_15205 [Pseudomonadota bacterium]